MKSKSKITVSGNNHQKENEELLSSDEAEVDAHQYEEDKSSEFESILKNSQNTYSLESNILYRYYAEVGKYPLLTAEEERQYGLAVKEGDMDAWRKLFKGNLRLVIMIAQRYQNQGVDLHDLISEGNLGVMHAISKFDPEKGFRFSTYAVWWIRHYLSNVIMNEGRTIRVPIHVNKAIAKMLSVTKKLSQEFNREPTINEIAQEMGQSLSEVMNLMANHESTLSLDVTISQDQENSSDFYNVVSDEDGNDATQILIGSEKLSLLKSFLHLLEPQAQKVIEYRFGVNGKNQKTLEKTGKILGLTRDQVRYSQTKALEALKDIFDDRGICLTDILS